MNKDDNPLTVETLIWDEDFRNHVLHPNESSLSFWKVLFLKHPGSGDAVLSAKQIILSMTVKNTLLKEEEKALLIQDTLRKININDTPAVYRNEPEHKIKNRADKQGYHLWPVTAAALLVLVMGIALWSYFNPANKNSVSYSELIKLSKGKLLEKVNTTASPQAITLEDGSKIILQKGAKISFPVTFTHVAKREVYVSGEVSFEIAEQPAKPFFVYAHGLITKVLGTVFKIRSDESQNKVTVEVVSGVVSFFSLIDKKSKDEDNSNRLSSLILTRNQKANFSAKDNSLMTSIVDTPLLKEEEKEAYRFVETPLDHVFNAIENGYGIEVIYDKESLAGEVLTANLWGKTRYDQLAVICKAINAHYKVIDGKIVIFRGAGAPGL